MEERYRIVAFTAKQVMEAGYLWSRGGVISGTHYCIYENGKGFCSLDGGINVFLMRGNRGRSALQDIIDAGGFVGDIDYRQSL